MRCPRKGRRDVHGLRLRMRERHVSEPEFAEWTPHLRDDPARRVRMRVLRELCRRRVAGLASRSKRASDAQRMMRDDGHEANASALLFDERVASVRKADDEQGYPGGLPDA